MSLAFDHLVIYKKKPEDAILPLKQKGMNVIQGGRHELWGTYNTLAYFGLSYIEFLGIEEITIAEKHEENRLITDIVQQLGKDKREGPARIAIRTNQIEELAFQLKEQGLKIYGPLPGERARPDGETIKWSLLFAEDEQTQSGLPLPFFIQWENQRDGSPASTKLASVGMVVHNLEEEVTKWANWFGLRQGEEFIEERLNAKCKTLELEGTNLLFCSPSGVGIAKRVLEERGETPFLINFEESNGTDFFEMFNGYWRIQS